MPATPPPIFQVPALTSPLPGSSLWPCLLLPPLSLLWLDLLHPHLPQPGSHLLWSCPPGAQGQVVCLCVSTRLGALCEQEPWPVFLASLCPAGILTQMWHHSICWLFTSLTAPITPLPFVETERGSNRTVLCNTRDACAHISCQQWIREKCTCEDWLWRVQLSANVRGGEISKEQVHPERRRQAGQVALGRADTGKKRLTKSQPGH